MTGRRGPEVGSRGEGRAEGGQREGAEGGGGERERGGKGDKIFYLRGQQIR